MSLHRVPFLNYTVSMSGPTTDKYISLHYQVKLDMILYVCETSFEILSGS